MPPAKERTATRPGDGRTVPKTDWWADTYRRRVEHGDLPNVLRALGYTINREGYLDPNPLRTERSPSAYVYGDHVRDYGPAENYDPVAFLMAAQGLDKRAAADLYADAAGIDRMDGERGKRADLRPVRPTKVQPPTVRRKLDTSWLTPLTEAAAAALEAAESPEAQRAHELLAAWGITPEVRRYLWLGVIDASVRSPGRPYATTGRERRMWWPYLEGDRTIYGNARAMYGEEPKTLVHAASIVGSRPAPYNVAAFDHAPTAGYLLMLEGEKDTAAALVALGVDAPALGLMSGTMPADGAWHERVAQLGVPAVVCFDRDEAGEGKAAKLAAALRAAGCTDVRLVSIPSPHKDAADVLAAEGAGVLRDVLQAWRRAPSVEADDLPERPPGDPGPSDADAPPDAAIMQRSAERTPERTKAPASKPTPPAPPPRRPRLVRLDTVQAVPVEHLDDGRLALGKTTMLVGDPGSGKTHIALAIAAQITRGRPVFPAAYSPGSHVREPANVLALIGEDGLADTIRARFDAADGDPSRFVALTDVLHTDEDGKVRDGEVDLTQLDVLDAAMTEVQPALVIVDPVQVYLGPGADMHRANEVRAALKGAARLAERHHASLLIIGHMNKSGGKALHRALGSVDFVAIARSVLVAGEHEGAPALAHAKANLSAKAATLTYSLEAGHLLWTGTTDATADDLTGAPPQDYQAPQQARAADWLVGILRQHGGTARVSDLELWAKAAGVAWRTIKRAKESVGISSRKAGTIGDAYWVWDLEE